jgi:hypothetical protein
MRSSLVCGACFIWLGVACSGQSPPGRLEPAASPAVTFVGSIDLQKGSSGFQVSLAGALGSHVIGMTPNGSISCTLVANNLDVLMTGTSAGDDYVVRLRQVPFKPGSYSVPQSSRTSSESQEPSVEVEAPSRSGEVWHLARSTGRGNVVLLASNSSLRGTINGVLSGVKSATPNLAMAAAFSCDLKERK